MGFIDQEQVFTGSLTGGTVQLAVGEHYGNNEPAEGNGRIQVYIGNETPIDSMKNCSVVTATYALEEGVYGKVGIIGPKRMDYERVVGTLKNLMGQLDDIFKNKQS